MSGRWSLPTRAFVLSLVGSVLLFLVDGAPQTPTVRHPASYTVSPPSVIENDLGVVVIRSWLGTTVSNCTGVPIRGTNRVVTAAHCVLQRIDGTVAVSSAIAVLLDGVVVAEGQTVMVAAEYVRERRARWDVAVVGVAQTWEDVGVEEWGGWPGEGTYEVYGMQTVGPDDVRVGRDNPPARLCDVVDCIGEPELRRCSISRELTSCRLTSCVGDCTAMTVLADGAARVPCGMLAGGSGGPMVVALDDGAIRLVGVVSMKSANERDNIVAPAATIDLLLAGGAGAVVLSVPPLAPLARY